MSLYKLPVIGLKVSILVKVIRIVNKAGTFLILFSQSLGWLQLALKIRKKEIHCPDHLAVIASPNLPWPPHCTMESAA